MARLAWDTTGNRFFETGTDRGVLYLPASFGVPWSGLISVEESTGGAGVEEYYLDGRKRLNRAMKEDFKAKLEAFSAPKAFDDCEGIVSLARGLHATQQTRSYFSLAYRTKVGNDVNQLNHGYKIHLVYNAIASTPNRAYKTADKKPKPITLSWQIETIPELSTSFRPSAHFVIDSTRMSEPNLQLLEDKLYGTDTTEPELPTPAAIIDLLV